MMYRQQSGLVADAQERLAEQERKELTGVEVPPCAVGVVMASIVSIEDRQRIEIRHQRLVVIARKPAPNPVSQAHHAIELSGGRLQDVRQPIARREHLQSGLISGLIPKRKRTPDDLRVLEGNDLQLPATLQRVLNPAETLGAV
jgi:hypothetical protein